MKNSDILLFFLIIYNIITSILFFFIWDKTRMISEEKSKYIDELIFELAKMRKK